MVTYTGKLVLAPMVRVGELPTRLLALKHGADLVWGPEIIDKKILTCERVQNEKNGTVDFLSNSGNIKKPGISNLVFRTCPELEKNKLIFQMGTANAELAVKAAKIIINDVDGIDINAGCPKHFSIHAGMGAALLKTPDILEQILIKLVNEVGKVYNKPISVKIRLLEKKEDSMALISRLLKTGISNLTLHCRTQTMRNREAPIRDYLQDIVKLCREHKVSFIINGGILNKNEFLKLQEKYGSDVGGMIAEGAENNASCFSEKPLDWKDLTKEFIAISVKYNHFYSNTKYCLSRIIPGKSKYYQVMARCKSMDDILEFEKSLDDDNGDNNKTVEKLSVNQKKRKNEGVEDEPNENLKKEKIMNCEIPV